MLDIGFTRYTYSKSVTLYPVYTAHYCMFASEELDGGFTLHRFGCLICCGCGNFFATLSCVNHMFVLLARLSCHCLLSTYDLWSCAWLNVLYFVSWLPVAAGMLTCAECACTLHCYSICVRPSMLLFVTFVSWIMFVYVYCFMDPLCLSAAWLMRVQVALVL